MLDKSKPETRSNWLSAMNFKNPKCVCFLPRWYPIMIHKHLQVNPKPGTELVFMS